MSQDKNTDVPLGCYIVVSGVMLLIGYLASQYKFILQQICDIVCQACK